MRRAVAWIVQAYRANEAASWRALDAILLHKGVLASEDLKALISRATILLGIAAILGIVAQYALTDSLIAWGCDNHFIKSEVCRFVELQNRLPAGTQISQVKMPCMDNETPDEVMNNTNWCWRFLVHSPGNGSGWRVGRVG
jgi:hypothetical protein